jgi:hypothetical protein
VPIPFAAARYIKRSQGHSAVERLAYITRTFLKADRTGETHDFRDREPAAHIATLAPSGTPLALLDAATLWNAVEGATKLENASLGIDLLVALPSPAEMTEVDAFGLLQRFILETVVRPHGLAATLALHRPHGALSDGDRFLELGGHERQDSFGVAMRWGILNQHAHVLITPRQVGPAGLGRWRYLTLDPSHRDGRLAAGTQWGRLWGRFQNRFFLNRACPYAFDQILRCRLRRLRFRKSAAGAKSC